MKEWYSVAVNKIRVSLKFPSHQEEIQCHDVVIFYNLVFDIGKTVNPTQVARDLLKNDFACTCTNSITDTIEVAPRLKELLKLRERAVQVDILSSYIQHHERKAAFSWILHHPRDTFYLLRTFARRKKEKHTQTSTPQQEDTTTSLKDTLDFIDHSMAKFQWLEGLQLYCDKLLFSPLYLREAPFVRVGLQPFFVTIDGEEIGVDVFLVIHRTGVAILTCGVMFEKPKTVDALIQLKVLEEIGVSRFEVAKALVDIPSTAHNLEHHKIIPTNKRSSGGIHWYEYKLQQPVKFSFIIHLYQDALLAAINKRTLKKNETFSWLRTRDWFAYPIMFIRQVTPKYPTGEALKKHHAHELAGLILGFSQWRKVKPEKIQEVLTKDLTLTSDYSFYLEASHATVIYHNDHLTELDGRLAETSTANPGLRPLWSNFQPKNV